MTRLRSVVIVPGVYGLLVRDTPDQPMNPPDPEQFDRLDYLEATADQWHDEQKEAS